MKPLIFAVFKRRLPVTPNFKMTRFFFTLIFAVFLPVGYWLCQSQTGPEIVSAAKRLPSLDVKTSIGIARCRFPLMLQWRFWSICYHVRVIAIWNWTGSGSGTVIYMTARLPSVSDLRVTSKMSRYLEFLPERTWNLDIFRPIPIRLCATTPADWHIYTARIKPPL